MIDTTIENTVHSVVGEHQILTQEMIGTVRSHFMGFSCIRRIASLPMRS